MAGVTSHFSNEGTNVDFQNFVTQFSSICEGTGLLINECPCKKEMDLLSLVRSAERTNGTGLIPLKVIPIYERFQCSLTKTIQLN